MTSSTAGEGSAKQGACQQRSATSHDHQITPADQLSMQQPDLQGGLLLLLAYPIMAGAV